MACKYGKRIDDFLNGKLDEKHEKELREHGKECNECGYRLRAIDDIDKLIAKSLSQYPYRSSKDKIMARVENKKVNLAIASKLYSFSRYAYAAAIVMALVISVYFLKPWMYEFNAKKQAANSYKSFEIFLVKGEENSIKAKSHGSFDIRTGKFTDGKNSDSDGNIVDINSLVLEDKPILTDEDILQYDWTNQIIEVTKEYAAAKGISDNDWSKRVVSGGSAILNSDSKGAFVVIVNGKRIYSGGFKLGVNSSLCPSEIGIEDISKNKIKIWNLKDNSDPRKYKEVYYFFKEKGKLTEPKE